MTELSTTWDLVERRTVNKNGYLPYPKAARKYVEGQKKTKPAVHWHFHDKKQYIILSDTVLRDSEFNYVDTTKIYDQDKIRPPGDENSDLNLKNYVRPGDTVTYLRHSAMDSDASSVYLLLDGQLTDLLPSNETDDDLAESLLGVPNILLNR